jgi:hypothetical protein
MSESATSDAMRDPNFSATVPAAFAVRTARRPAALHGRYGVSNQKRSLRALPVAGFTDRTHELLEIWGCSNALTS